jgi:hypothetical protein
MGYLFTSEWAAISHSAPLDCLHLYLTISIKDKPYQQERNCDDYQHWQQANEEDKYQGKCKEQDHE